MELATKFERGNPLLNEEEWTRHKQRSREASAAERTGWSSRLTTFGRLDHPVCSTNEASRHLFMSQPPLLAEEGTGLAETSVVQQQAPTRSGVPRAQVQNVLDSSGL